MDKIKKRISDQIGNGAGDGAEAEEAEEEGWWEGRDRTMTKGHCTGRDEDDYDNYALPYPESEAEAASSNSKLEIPFVFGPSYSGLPPRSRG